MSWQVDLGDHEIVVTHTDLRWSAPLGVRTLLAQLLGDPPRPRTSSRTRSERWPTTSTTSSANAPM